MRAFFIPVVMIAFLFAVLISEFYQNYYTKTRGNKEQQSVLEIERLKYEKAA